MMLGMRSQKYANMIDQDMIKMVGCNQALGQGRGHRAEPTHPLSPLLWTLDSCQSESGVECVAVSAREQRAQVPAPWHATGH